MERIQSWPKAVKLSTLFAMVLFASGCSADSSESTNQDSNKPTAARTCDIGSYMPFDDSAQSKHPGAAFLMPRLGEQGIEITQIALSTNCPGKAMYELKVDDCKEPIQGVEISVGAGGPELHLGKKLVSSDQLKATCNVFSASLDVPTS